MKKTIGILALQGAFREHAIAIKRTGNYAIEIKEIKQLDVIDGLIIPGGESTTIGKLMVKYGFIEPVRKLAKKGMPLFGTCAGLVLLAKEVVDGYKDQPLLGLMDTVVRRNAFGRQRESFEDYVEVRGQTCPLASLEISVGRRGSEVSDPKPETRNPKPGFFPAVFIRAPWIEEVGDNVTVISEYQGKVVMARQGKLLATAFHPELTDDLRVHQYFMKMIEARVIEARGDRSSLTSRN